MSLGVNSGVSPPTQIFQSFCQNITASVFISVENTAALTSMGSFRQRFFDGSMTETTFLTGVLRRNSDDNLAKYLPIIFQPLKELSPSCIANAFGKAMILDHITHHQFLEHHQIVRFDHTSCQFHGKIFTLARDFQVFSSQFVNRFSAFVRAFDFTAYSSLQTFKSFFRLLRWRGFSILLP